MKKKIISLSLILTILLSVFMPLTAISATEYKMTIYPETNVTNIKAGDKVTIVIKAEGDKITSFDGYLDYDTEVFELLSDNNDDEEWEGIAPQWDNDFCYQDGSGLGLYYFGVSNTKGTSKYDATGELIKFTLTVKKATDLTKIKITNINVAYNGDVIDGTDTECEIGSSQFNVTFDENGGTFSGSAKQTDSAEQGKAYTIPSENLTSSAVTRVGYTFLGWSKTKYTTSQTSATYTSSNATVAESETTGNGLTLYAVWKLNQGNLTIIPNGFSGYTADGITNGTSITNKNYGETASITKPSTSPNTYQVRLNANGGNINGVTYSNVTANVTFNNWVASGDAGSWDNSSETFTFQPTTDGATSTLTADFTVETVDLSTITATRDGYNLLGWSEDASATTATYDKNDKYTPSIGDTLYAVWEKDSYTVTFDKNTTDETAKLDMTSKSVNYDSNYETLATGTRKGYTLEGWYKESNCTNKVTNNTKVTTAADHTLYAKWTINNYSVTYSNMVGATWKSGVASTAHDNSSVQFNSQYTITTDVPEKVGYKFLGWNKETASSTTPDYKAGDTFTMEDSNVTLYAVWEGATYKITYIDATGDPSVSGIPQEETKTYETPINISTETPTRTGYTFVEWNTNPDGSGTSYQKGSTYSKEEDLKLYAQWEEKTFTITYSPTVSDPTISGMPTPLTETKYYFTDLTVTSAIPTRTGYTFNGWKADTEGAGTKYTAGDKITINQDLTLYAQWTPISYTIKFEGNGNDGGQSMSTQIFTYDVQDNLIKNTFTKTGYVFDHWNTKEDDSGDSYNDEAEILNITTNNNDVITLYAQWREYKSIHKVEFYSDNTYTTLLYTDNNVKDGTAANYQGEIPTKPEDAKNTYTFDHWEPVPNNVTKDMKVYAVFKENIKQYTVTFYDEDNTTILGTSTVNYGENASYNGDTTSLTGTPKAGYTKTFKGWEDSSKLNNVTEDRKVVATYNEELIKYNISYNNTYGGVNKNPTQYTVEDSDIILQDIARKGYIFEGWYTESSFENKVTTINTTEAKNITLYAKWKVDSSSGPTITDNLYYVKVLFEDETTEENTFEYFNDARIYADIHVDENVRVFDSKGHIVYEPSKKTEDLYLKSNVYTIGKTNTYVEGDVYISRIKPETTLMSLKNQLITNGEIEVYRTNGTKLNDDEYVGTNMVLRVTKNEQAIVLTIAVIGDLDGNGKITVTDLSILNNALIGNIILSEPYEIAGDIDNNNKLSISDLSDLNKIIIGKLIF